MPHPRFTNEEIARRGEEIYASRLRDSLEKEHKGQVVIIDIESGEYEIGHDSLAANKRALEKRPGAAAKIWNMSRALQITWESICVMQIPGCRN